MTDNYINTLNQIISRITLYVPFFTITIGTIGGLCNLITFSAKQLRQNACAFYFLCSAIFDLLTLLFCAVMRLMVDHYNYLLPNTSPVFCKLRTFLTALLPAISTCCIMLASIDRCLLTSISARWRNWSNIKVARRLVFIAIIIWIISTFHMLIFYDFYALGGNSNVCSSRPGIYSTFISAFFVIYLTIIPYLIMFISSLSTFLHIKASRNRIVHSQAHQQRQQQQQQHETRRRIDRNLILMVFIQVIFSMLLLSMRSGVIAYQLLTRDISRDTRRRAIESFISELSTVTYYINYAKSFFVYTLTSSLFREVFWKRICQLFNYIHHPTRVTIGGHSTITVITRKCTHEVPLAESNI